VHSPRLRGSAGILLAAIAVGAAAGSPVTAAGSETEYMTFRASSGPVRMVGFIAAELLLEDLVVSAGAAGLGDATRYRIVGSTRPCTQAHASSARVFSVPLPPVGADGAAIISDKATPKLTEAFMRSARLYTKLSGGNQVACARVVHLTEAEATAGSSGDTWFDVTRFANGVQGLVVMRVVPGDSATMSAVLTGLPPGSTTRIAPTDAVCGDPPDGDTVLGQRTATASSGGVLAFVDRPVGLFWQALVENQIIPSTRLLKGTEGYQQRRCGLSLNFTKID
jgi:hypothetical protein